MIFRSRVRETAVALISAAITAAGGTVANSQVSSSVDNPNWSGHGPFISVKTEDKKVADGFGGAPTLKTTVVTTISIRAEGANVYTDGKLTTSGAVVAQNLLDQLAELVENTLLGGQGWSLNLTTTKGYKSASPADVTGLATGMSIYGPCTGQDNYIDSIDSATGTVTLAKAATATGTFVVKVGSFVGLFEGIDSVDTFADYDGENQKYHTWSADIEISAHVTEIFEPTVTTDLKTVAIYVGRDIDPASDPDAEITY